MRKRYEKTQTRLRGGDKSKSKVGKTRHLTIPKYVKVPRSPQDLYIKATHGMRLDIISNNYYGTPKYWWVLALANNMGKGTMFVTPGYQLRIPHNPHEFVSKQK